MAGRTVYDKIWDAHAVAERGDGMTILYIDRHLLHEVTSPQAFEGLALASRQPWRVDANLATPDHNVPTTNRAAGIAGIEDPIAKAQVVALDENCKRFNIRQFEMTDVRQGIVHVIGPEQGATLPGMTIVCGDSHTSTHGAFAALAHGIGTSEVEHVLATQCLVQRKSRNMRINVEGELGPGVGAKDLILAIIGRIGTAGATGHAIEYAGSAVRALSMEGRMTLCNMSIEAGARAGLVAVDDTTIDYLRDRPFAPSPALWESAEAYWRSLVSDANVTFDGEVTLDAREVTPQVTWGTSPEWVLGIEGTLPAPTDFDDPGKRDLCERALAYMDLSPRTPIASVPVDRVFIGSCTNGRIEDFRTAAEVLDGRKVAASVTQALAVPGSGLVAQQAEEEGLDAVFKAAGFEWRAPGCSMCLAMNDDRLLPGERCAATSNRNFEGRQGYRGRTHLVSPSMAAAAAVAGHFTDVREML